MINFLSFSDLASIVREHIDLIDDGIDMVVGIPRSGMIPAFMIGLFKNILVTDLESFLSDVAPGHGQTRDIAQKQCLPLEARSILLVDDSFDKGFSLASALCRIEAKGFRGRIRTCVAVVSPEGRSKVDIFFKILPHPRLFEWNSLHHSIVENSCFDMDGILCCDPTVDENDDGPKYEVFLQNAVPFFTPTRKIGHIVSARLERHRAATESWLRRHEVAFGQLHLVNLSTASERRRLDIYSSHKATVYRQTNAALFFESEPRQAIEIANLSGKPVLCTKEMRMHYPTLVSFRGAQERARWSLRRAVRFIFNMFPLRAKRHRLFNQSL